MKMSDAERLEIVAHALEKLAISYCDVIRELSNYRAVDREERLLDDVKKIIGKAL